MTESEMKLSRLNKCQLILQYAIEIHYFTIPSFGATSLEGAAVKAYSFSED